MRVTDKLKRREVLRGMMGAAAVSVGLPFLDCFLNTNGTALANGAALPVVFTNWFQGLGFTPGFWEPKTQGFNYENNLRLKPLDPFKNKITVFSGLRAYSDGNVVVPHGTGPQVCLAGGIPRPNQDMPTVDTIIADAVGTRTRFRTLEVRCDGRSETFSRRSASSSNPAESSPLAMYNRIFGADFQDPNADDFKADPNVLARKSVLSAVTDQRTSWMTRLGAADKARLEEYFTSLRQLEQQLALQLQKPDPMPSCRTPAGALAETTRSSDMMDVRRNHRLFAELLTHAAACNLTNVLGMSLSGGAGGSGIRKAGNSMTFHVLTHEEQVDPKLGYQPTVGWFQEQVVEAILEYLTVFDKYKEGPNSLLDRALIMYSTDNGDAKSHSQLNMPMMLMGGAGGRLKPGQHIVGGGHTVARVGLTIQRIMGLPVTSWGSESNLTSSPFTEVMA